MTFILSSHHTDLCDDDDDDVMIMMTTSMLTELQKNVKKTKTWEAKLSFPKKIQKKYYLALYVPVNVI